MSRIRIRFDERMGEVVDYALYPPDDVSERALRAFCLAPTLEIYRALLAGGRVPIELLDQEALSRYGLRR